MDAPESRHPASLTAEYPDRTLNRLSTTFRIFAAIPVAVITALLVVIPGTELLTSAAHPGI